MVNTLYLPELREMLAERNAEELTEFCTALHPARTADFMDGLTPDETWQVLQYAEPVLRREIFGYLTDEMQVEIVESQERAKIAGLVANLAPDDRVDMLDEVDDAVVDELLPLLPTNERRDILRLRAFPDATAGAIMTTEVAMLSESLPVRKALEEISRKAEHLETIYYIYVVDDENHLRGVVTCRQLVSAMAKDLSLGDLMEGDVATVHVMDDQEDVAQKVARFDLLAIPVVDDEYRMVGIITHDDVMDVFVEEATEDAHRIAGVEPLEATYLKTPIFTLSYKRGMWLVILFFGALLTAFALEHYDQRIAEHSWLVIFIPLVISAGGNSGSQSATLVITALATGDVQLHDWLRVVLRELAMGMILGGFLGLIGLGTSLLMLDQSFAESMIVPITLVLVVGAGTLTGSALPLIFSRLGLDPAMMSNPFVAGIIDILGIVIYMNVALALIPAAA